MLDGRIHYVGYPTLKGDRRVICDGNCIATRAYRESDTDTPRGRKPVFSSIATSDWDWE